MKNLINIIIDEIELLLTNDLILILLAMLLYLLFCFPMVKRIYKEIFKTHDE